MEELEYDDGQRDFGSLSRGSEHLRRRKREELQAELIDWGEEGALFHLPLTSLFYPVLSIPSTLHRIFDPPLHFLQLYRASFSDGTQKRGLQKFREEVEKGGAYEVVGKIQRQFARRVEMARDEVERAREEQKRADAKVGQGADGKGNRVDGVEILAGGAKYKVGVVPKGDKSAEGRERDVRKVGNEPDGKSG